MSPSEAAPSGLLAWTRVALSVAFVVTLPLLLIGTNLRWLVNDRDLMLSQFDANQVGTTTGLDRTQLAAVADAFVAYFGAPPGRLDVQVTTGGQGQRRALFNQRELDHMEDVQALVQVFLRLQVVATGVAVARLLVAAFVERSAASVGRDMLLASGVLVTVVVLVGVLAAIDFSALWTRFHLVAFRNDLWLLDPTKDALIMLFPEPSWVAYTVRMAGATAIQTVLLAVAGFACWRYAP